MVDAVQAKPIQGFFESFFGHRIPLNDALGIEALALEPREAPERLLLRLPANPDLVGDADAGVLFGGALFTLIDTACGFLAMAALPGGPGSGAVATLDLRVDYLRPAAAGEPVLAEARLLRAGRQVVFCGATAWQGEQARPVAEALGSFMVTGPAQPGSAA